jgi:2-polyprenyl-3-methyl-5-hydroxy-6-metoxy-1,4-benzoquinol methylase
MERLLEYLYSLPIFKRYEDPSLLKQYIRSQYGPFLLRDPYDKSESFYQAVISESAPYLHPNSIACDVGCGVGRLAFEWSKVAKQTTGIDSSKKFIAFCKSIRQHKFVRYETDPVHAPTFICADALAYPFEAPSFDFVSCINVIDRVAHPQRLAETLANALTPDGTLVLSTPYDWGLSPAVRSERVSDITQLLGADVWNVKKELWLDYTIPISNTEDRTYRCHTVIAQKK